jgi:hypothetical protein
MERLYPTNNAPRCMNLLQQFIGRLVELGASCNADDRFTPPGRLEARQIQLEALQQGIDGIRPVFSRFESELTDVQKARLGSLVNVSTAVTSAVH